MATYTSNLNLKKPLGTEHVSRQDMNDNYDKIDAGVVTNVDGEISNSLLIGVRASGSSIGARSMAIGGNVEASGMNSFACGNGAKASGSASHAEQSANATGYHSHAENASTASGEGSHAENQSDAVGKYSHSENYGYAKGNYSHAEGYGTYAKGKGQHVGGKFNVYDPTGDYDEYGTYAEIIGNGTAAGSANRSNARTLDWDGNEYLKGDLYVGCNADSTGGTKVPTTPFSGASSSTAGSAGLVPAPSAGDQDKFLAGDGIWKVPSGGSDMTGATESTAGTHGLVPAPAAGDQNKVLKGDGTWGEMDVSGKADKVSGATNGNFAGLDSNGNLTDSEVGPEDLLQLDSELEDGTKAAPADVVGQLALMKTDHIYNETEPSAICSVSDGAALPIKTMNVSIDPVQEGSGDPSPENVRPISGWDSANVSRTGVNVWDEEWESGYINTTTGAKVADASKIRTKNPIPVKPNTTYYYKTPVAMYICSYDADMNFIQRLGGSKDTTITTPSNCAYIMFGCESAYGTTYNHDISINYPSTDTQYHAYSGTTAEYEFPQGAGTVYGGTLTIHQDGTGSLVVENGEVDLGTLTWSKVNNYFVVAGNDLPANFGFQSYGFSKVGNLKCSDYKTVAWSTWSTNDYCIALNDTYFGIKDTSKSALTATEFKTAMSGVQLVYELATPVTYQLTNQQVIALLKGANNVWADCGDVSLEYPADTKLYIDGKIAEIQALILENISNS